MKYRKLEEFEAWQIPDNKKTKFVEVPLWVMKYCTKVKDGFIFHKPWMPNKEDQNQFLESGWWIIKSDTVLAPYALPDDQFFNEYTFI